MGTPTWIVEFSGTDATEQVVAEGWQIGPNGDLVFVNTTVKYGSPEFEYLRAFAAGTWTEVRRYV